MQLGDLVMLSAYGRNRKRAEWIEPDEIGIIVKVRHWGGAHSAGQDYRVKWNRSDFKQKRSARGYVWHWEEYNQRKDLKYVK